MFATYIPAIVASSSNRPRNDRVEGAAVEASEVDMKEADRRTGPCAVLKRADHTGAAGFLLTAGPAVSSARD